MVVHNDGVAMVLASVVMAMLVILMMVGHAAACGCMLSRMVVVLVLMG